MTISADTFTEISNRWFIIGINHFKVYFQEFSSNPNIVYWKDYIVFFVIHYFIFIWTAKILNIGTSFQEFFNSTKKSFFKGLRRIPFVESKIQKELDKVMHKMEEDMISSKRPNLQHSYSELPSKGLQDDKVLTELTSLSQLNKVEWQKGKVSGTVYHGGSDMSKLLAKAYEMYSVSNPLHPDVFPATRVMEAHILSMTSRLFNAPGSFGNITSGGTESILMACKAYRDRAKDLFNIVDPEMIIPETAHAAFDKAASYFKIKVRHASLGNDWKVNLKVVESLITRNTVMIVGSAPNYPHGIIDDIEGLGRLALKYNVGLHVDCCLGSFMMPFMNEAGYQIPPFDFRVPGVTSLSCDTHKFGFASKGTSVILYSSSAIRKYQYFVAESWPGGIYASPSVAGSRSGGLIACCWTALVKTGRDGYLESCKSIVGAARQIRDGIKNIDGIEVCGNPLAMVVAFQSKSLNVYAISDSMSAKGWNLNALQYPSAVHICCTRPTTLVVKQFLQDLKESVKEIKDNPNISKDGMGAIYGMAASIPDKSMVVDITRGYLDLLTKS